MTAKTSETGRMVDQIAKAAHDMVDRMHEIALKLETSIDVRTQGSGDRVVAKFEERTRSIEDYIEANPAMAAAVGFGLGICATRLMKAQKPASVTAQKPASVKAQKPASIRKPTKPRTRKTAPAERVRKAA